MKEYINITIDDEEGTTSAVLKEGSSDEKIYTIPYKPILKQPLLFGKPIRLLARLQLLMMIRIASILKILKQA